jgi:hypothetical protein
VLTVPWQTSMVCGTYALTTHVLLALAHVLLNREVKVAKPHLKKPHLGSELSQHVLPAHHEVVMPRPCRSSGRMCSNSQCKNPFDSPQWRRGPLGPGTLCNACGTRYARLQAKMNGDKKVGVLHCLAGWHVQTCRPGAVWVMQTSHMFL